MKKIILFCMLVLSFAFYTAVQTTSQTYVDKKQTISHYKKPENDRSKKGSKLYFQNKQCRFPKQPGKNLNLFEQAFLVVKTTLIKFKKIFINT